MRFRKNGKTKIKIRASDAFSKTFLFLYGVFAFCFLSCSFDYGASVSQSEDEADVVMENVNYVRVRDGIPQVQFDAVKAQRFEKKQLMQISNFSFKQFDRQSMEVDASGEAGSAEVELDTGNVSLRDGVRISVESEEIVIETMSLGWEDKLKILSVGKGEAVTVEKSDGSLMSGRGFSANIRARTWEFAEGVGGTYVHNNEEEEADQPNVTGRSSLEEEDDE